MTAASHHAAAPIVLLGPQTDFAEIGEVLDEFKVAGTVALVTTGWQENESEDEALVEQLRRPAVNLALHARSERVYAQEPLYAKARASRQARLQHLQRFYRMRLEAIDEAARAIGVRHVDAEILQEQQSITVAQMRQLDEDHLQRCQAEWTAFDQQWPAAEQASIARERAAIAEQTAQCAAIVIAGGHLTALLNRLRLFDVLATVGNKPIIAWSAGAMSLTDRIVLFHDSPPFGKNLAQMLDVGLGLASGVVVMPDPRHRLRTDQPQGIARFTQRMAPALCLGMDPGARLVFRGGHLVKGFADRLLPDGRMERGWRP
jgi:hypothetical protein